MKNAFERNRAIHDRVFKSYNIKHTEIYNEHEQRRLTEMVASITEQCEAEKPHVLDVGAGTGNVSLKVLKAGGRVTALDISKNSLRFLRQEAGKSSDLCTRVLQGGTFPFKENTFDIVCAYSVLHHIPDYLHTVREMCRVVKPGGFVYIDHEASEMKYMPNEALSEYGHLTKQTVYEHLAKLFRSRELFTYGFIKGVFMRIFIDPRYAREGDIHVWKDKHINWDKIKEAAFDAGCKIAREEDYLLYKPKGGRELYDRYRDKCADTKYAIFSKLS